MANLNIKTNTIVLTKILIALLIIQTIRITIVKGVFLFCDKTSLNNVIINSILMTLFTVIIIIFSRIKGKSLSIVTDININNKSRIIYCTVTIIALLLIVLNPIFTQEYNIGIITSIIYSAIIVPIFEEILFRGYIWNNLKNYYKNEFKVYITITILFAIWHIGYFDSIILNMSIHGLTENILFVMFMKVVTGLVFGVIIGFVRYKTKNTYAAVLTHSIMNIFGK